MALDSRTRARLGWIAAAVAPILAVQAASLLSGGAAGPAAAAAGVSGVLALSERSVLAPRVEVTEEQQLAIDWFRSRRAAADTLRSPIDAPPIRKAAASAPVVEAEPLPALRLGGISSRRNGAVASINNRLYCAGDQPLEKWTILAIDADAREVTLEGVDGRRIRLSSDGLKEVTVSQPNESR